MPGLFCFLTLFLDLSALKPPMKPGKFASSSPGKKPLLTIPLGIYIMANFFAGLAPFLGSPAIEGMKGKVRTAPLTLRKFLLFKLICN